jgi:hypothetical protein
MESSGVLSSMKKYVSHEHSLAPQRADANQQSLDAKNESQILEVKLLSSRLRSKSLYMQT